VLTDERSLREMIKDLFQSQNLAALSTRGKEYSYCSLVGFIGTEDLKHIVFATLRNTRKYNNIIAHPRISILIDSRSNTIRDFEDATALTIIGHAYEAVGEEKERLSMKYLEKHPHLRDFIQDPDCAVIDLEVKKYIIATRFQQVMELDI
jgi:nitroimidazol reductase NimA-like FMN-containing flavoprotein (pyridoxamine 5'-phosphate oxidase superfamily)